MAGGSITDECTLAVPADRLWKAAMSADVSIYPKACAGIIDSVEVDGDNAAPGAITTMKLNAAVAGVEVMRSRLVERDNAARVLKNEVLLEGGELKSQETQVRLEAAGDGASLVKLKVDYEKHDGGELSPEEAAKITQGYLGLLKQVEAYLLVHPAEYA